MAVVRAAEIAIDVGGVEADVAVVDALARLQLAARRGGCTIRLRNPSPELRELIALLGLSEVLRE